MTGFPLFRHFSALATPSDFASCFLRLRPGAARRFWPHVAAKAATRSAPRAGFRFPSRFLLHVVKSEKMRPPVRTDTAGIGPNRPDSQHGPLSGVDISRMSGLALGVVREALILCDLKPFLQLLDGLGSWTLEVIVKAPEVLGRL